MNINNVKKWILDRGSRKGPHSLAKINYILDELESPQTNYASVIIAGTNGKGSVTSILESILINCEDYQIGAFTSPHLKDLRERVRIQGKQLKDHIWEAGYKKVKKIIKLMDKEASIGSPGFIETITAIALWAFSETERDLVLLEVGLGGRLDSTNSTEPEISVITNIGTDHQEYLGETKELIANEKFGVTRKRRPLITSEKDPSIIKMFEDRCKEQKSPLIKVNRSDFFTVIESTSFGHNLKTIYSDENIFFNMPGDHQLSNLATALATILQLRKNGFSISDKAIAKGIANARWAGRLEWIDYNPPILLDGAHNLEGIAALTNYLENFPPESPLYTIFGTLSDKPFAFMAEQVAAYSDKVVIVPPKSPRAITKDVIEGLNKSSDKFIWCETVAEAIDLATKEASNILVTGSIYLLSDAIRYIESKCSNQD